MRPAKLPRLLLGLLALLSIESIGMAQCPPTGSLRNYLGPGTVSCPCFVVGEEAGVFLNAPAADYPIEITRIRVGWGSQFGGAPPSLEDSLRLYAAGSLTPQFSLSGPVLVDGVINDFDISMIPGNRVITSGPFGVSLRFANSNAGNIFAPTIVHDGAGCISGTSFVNAIPGGRLDSCVAGLTGNWVIEVEYKKAASNSIFNGSNVNPLILTPLTTPSIGTSYVLDLDCTGHAPGLSVLIGVPAPGVPFGPIATSYGELLINSAGAQVFKVLKPHVGGVANYSLPVPLDPALCGLNLHIQGACLGSPGVALSNAVAARPGQ